MKGSYYAAAPKPKKEIAGNVLSVSVIRARLFKMSRGGLVPSSFCSKISPLQLALGTRSGFFYLFFTPSFFRAGSASAV